MCLTLSSDARREGSANDSAVDFRVVVGIIRPYSLCNLTLD